MKLKDLFTTSNSPKATILSNMIIKELETMDEVLLRRIIVNTLNQLDEEALNELRDYILKG